MGHIGTTALAGLGTGRPTGRACGREGDSTGWGGCGEGKRGPDPEQLLGQVPTLVDAPVHGHEALQARLVPDVGIVKTGVQHDHGEGQHIACVCSRQSGGEDTDRRGPGPSFPKPPRPGPHLWTGRPQGCTGSIAGQRLPSSGQSSGPLRGGGSSRETACIREEPGIGAMSGRRPSLLSAPMSGSSQ